MSKILLMRGLPGSGKSTRAKEIFKSGGNYYRVNRDHLREMMFFSEHNGKREKLTIDAEFVVAATILIQHNANVIVDDCNLGQKHIDMWNEFARKVSKEMNHPVVVEVEDVDTPIEECVARDSARDRSVGASVIYGMAMQHGRYKPKSVVLCDIDGTIADGTHRLHHLYSDVANLIPKEPKDWKSYFAELMKDSPRKDVIKDVLKSIEDGSDLFLISARPEDYRDGTEAWLHVIAFDGAIPQKALFMRKKGDKRDDTIIKRELLNKYFPDKSIIKAVFDDRPRVIRMWREEGLNVIDVGKGIEF